MNAIANATDRLAMTAGDLAAAAETVERTGGVLRDARALRVQLEKDRAHARGRIANGEPEAVADLDRLRAEFIVAGRAVQDAEQVTTAARGALEHAKTTHEAAKQELGTEYAVLLLALRSAQATSMDQALEAAVAAGRAYLGVARELDRLAAALGLPSGPDPEPWVARRVCARLHTLAPRELRGYNNSEQPVAHFDAELTRTLRQQLPAAGGSPDEAGAPDKSGA